MKFIRIFLLILIIIGFGLLLTKNFWVPKLVEAIIYYQDGQASRVENIGNISGKKDLIRVTSPLANAEVSSPVTITGEARGTWYFEASFPVMLTDWDGKIIAQGIAQAQGDWMTTNFVPFKATLTFKKSDVVGKYSNKGTLILKKDNPSGLPEKDDALEIPVLLK